LEAQGLKVAPVPAGVSGDTSARMLSRTDGVLRKKPTWMTLSCGFNDMSPYCSWQVSIEDFKKNVTEILDKAQAAGVKVVMLTPTLLQDNPEDSEFNQKAKPYVEFMRQIAKDRNLPLADMNEAHRAEVKRLKDAKAPYGLQADGIHMNPHGDQMMATVVLRTFGLTDEQIAKAKESWLNNVYRREIRDWKNITVRQFEKIELFAAREKIDVNEAIGLLWERALITATKANAGISKQSEIREAAQVHYSKDLDALLDTELSVKSLR